MTFLDAARLASSGLRGNVVRTILTILGLAVGVGAVLTVLTLGDAGEERVETEIAKLGVNKVWVRSKGEDAVLTDEDARILHQTTDSPACAGAYTAAQMYLDGSAELVQAVGFDDSFQSVYSPKLLEGRMFRSEDFQQGSHACLIDEVLAGKFDEDVLGKRISIGNRRLRVIGVIKSLTVQSMSAGSGMVVMPLSTYLDTFGGKVAEITLVVQRDQSAKEVADAALSALIDRNAYRADTLEKEINAAREVVRIFVMVLVCVAAVCVLTGGIGVMNVLLLSVRERRQEIGLIKAIGGTGAQVCLLFLLEAAAYSVLGGLLGVVLGAAMIWIFGAWIGLHAGLALLTVLPVLGVSTLLGVVFGVIPALKAAMLQPVDALQREG